MVIGKWTGWSTMHYYLLSTINHLPSLLTPKPCHTIRSVQKATLMEMVALFLQRRFMGHLVHLKSLTLNGFLFLAEEGYLLNFPSHLSYCPGTPWGTGAHVWRIFWPGDGVSGSGPLNQHRQHSHHQHLRLTLSEVELRGLANIWDQDSDQVFCRYSLWLTHLRCNYWPSGHTLLFCVPTLKKGEVFQIMF